MNNSKIFGSTLIIAGTTIGAGMLALPISSAGLGFGTSFIIMACIWGLMAYTALLMIELHQHSESDATLHTLAQQFLGLGGKWLATFAMLFLFYSLCAAYIAGGGEQFHNKLLQWLSWEIPKGLGTVIFTIIIALIVTLGTHLVDTVNRVLFSCKLIAMIIMLFVLTPNIHPVNLLNMPLEKGLIVAALPVIFTSFGFHGTIPAVVRYLELDVKALKKVMIIGSLLPLLVYVLWQLAALGVLNQAHLSQVKGVSSLVNTLSSMLNSPMIASVISLFADLALITSFLGVSLGLFEFLSDSFNKRKNKRGRSLIAFMTFLPPLGFALFYPQGFMMALGFAAIALAILAVILPVIMIIKSRQQHIEHQEYTVAGGRLALMIAFAMGMSIIVIQLWIAWRG